MVMDLTSSCGIAEESTTEYSQYNGKYSKNSKLCKDKKLKDLSSAQNYHNPLTQLGMPTYNISAILFF
jgi:hypothetical protein